MSTTEKTDWLTSPGPHKLDRPQLIGLIVAALVFLGLWGAAITSYSDQPKVIKPAPIVSSQGLFVGVQATSFNTSTENLVLQLKLHSSGDLLDAKGLLKEAIALRIQDADDLRVIRIAAGEPLGTRETTVQLNGDASQYPFDKYNGQLTMQADKVLTSGEDVPLALSVGTKRSDSGWYTKFIIKSNSQDETAINIASMRREQFHIMFAIMLTLLLLLLACISAAVGFLCITNRRTSEPSVVSWLSGVLIAMTLTRRMMPGDPPLGCLLDIGLFAWALVLGIIAIALAMFAWLRQSRASHEKDEAAAI